MYHKYNSENVINVEAIQELPPRQYRIISGDAFESEPTEWLYPNVFVLGGINAIQGVPGCGKSFSALGLCTAVSMGGLLPAADLDGDEASGGGMVRIPRGKALYISGDDPKGKLKGRLEVMGADMSRMMFMADDNVPPLDDPEWESIIQDAGSELSLVVIDPLQCAIPGHDMHRANEMAEAMLHTRALAERHNICFVIIQHTGKQYSAGRGGDPVYGGIGSSAISGSFRAIWEVVRLKDGDGKLTPRRAMMPAKTSYAEGDPPNILFSLSRMDGFQWVGVDRELSVHNIHTEQVRPAHRPDDKRRAAEAFIEEYLNGGQKPTEEVKAAAEREGISERTFYRAVRELGGEFERVEGVSCVRLRAVP